MRILHIFTLLIPLVAADLYKETQNFQYSRTSSDDGEKKGFYGSQSGNMGGNFEVSHNMDTLAQRQLGTLKEQVGSQLGVLPHALGTGAVDQLGAGSLYGSASTSGTAYGVKGSEHEALNSRTGYNRHAGSQMYDANQREYSSNYAAGSAGQRTSTHNANAYEGTQARYGASGSTSGLSSQSSQRNTADRQMAATGSRYVAGGSRYQTSSNADHYETVDNQRGEAGSLIGSGSHATNYYVPVVGVREVPVDSAAGSRYTGSATRQQSSASGYEQTQSGYVTEEQRNAASSSSGVQPIYVQPGSTVRIAVRPNQRVPIQVPVQARRVQSGYTTHDSSSSLSAKSLNSDSQVHTVGTDDSVRGSGLRANSYVSSADANQIGTTGQTGVKGYQQSYSYQKEWERHGSSGDAVRPVAIVPTLDTVTDFGGVAQNRDKLLIAGMQVGSQDSDSTIYNSGSRVAGRRYGTSQTYQERAGQTQSSGYRTDAQHVSGQASNANAYGSGYTADSSRLTSGQDHHIDAHSQGAGHRTDLSRQSAGHTYDASSHNQGSASSTFDDKVATTNTKPVSYQSSYSYHKAWEKHGDPYVIKPATYGSSATGALTNSEYEHNQDMSQAGSEHSNRYSEDQRMSSASHSAGSQYRNTENSYNTHDSLASQTDNLNADMAGLQQKLKNQMGQMCTDCGTGAESGKTKGYSASYSYSAQRSYGGYEDQNKQRYKRADNNENKKDSEDETLNKTFKDLEETVKNLVSELQKYKTELKSDIIDYKNKGDTEKVRNKRGTFRSHNNREYEAFGQETEDLGQQVEDLGQQTEDLGQQTEDLGQQTEDLGQHTLNNYRDIHTDRQTMQTSQNSFTFGSQSRSKQNKDPEDHLHTSANIHITQKDPVLNELNEMTKKLEDSYRDLEVEIEKFAKEYNIDMHQRENKHTEKHNLENVDRERETNKNHKITEISNTDNKNENFRPQIHTHDHQTDDLEQQVEDLGQTIHGVFPSNNKYSYNSQNSRIHTGSLIEENEYFGNKNMPNSDLRPVYSPDTHARGVNQNSRRDQVNSFNQGHIDENENPTVSEDDKDKHLTDLLSLIGGSTFNNDGHTTQSKMDKIQHKQEIELNPTTNNNDKSHNVADNRRKADADIDFDGNSDFFNHQNNNQLVIESHTKPKPDQRNKINKSGEDNVNSFQGKSFLDVYGDEREKEQTVTNNIRRNHVATNVDLTLGKPSKPNQPNYSDQLDTFEEDLGQQTIQNNYQDLGQQTNSNNLVSKPTNPYSDRGQHDNSQNSRLSYGSGPRTNQQNHYTSNSRGSEPTYLNPQNLHQNNHDLGQQTMNENYHDLGQQTMNENYHDLGQQTVNANYHDLGQQTVNANYHDLGQQTVNANYNDLGQQRVNENYHDLGQQTVNANYHDLGQQTVNANYHDLGQQTVNENYHDLGQQTVNENYQNLGHSNKNNELGRPSIDQSGKDKTGTLVLGSVNNKESEIPKSVNIALEVEVKAETLTTTPQPGIFKRMKSRVSSWFNG